MAYNNGFPVNYQQYYPQYPQAQYQQIPSSTQASGSSNSFQNGTNSIIWVQGEAGAKSYLVAPNTTVQLWDSEAQVIYLKSADASGMPSMKILDYTIREATSQGSSQSLSLSNSPDFVTKDEFIAFEEKFQKQLDKLSASKSKKEVKNDGESSI